MFPEWEGDALIGGLAGQALVRLTLEGERVSGERATFRARAGSGTWM